MTDDFLHSALRLDNSPPQSRAIRENQPPKQSHRKKLYIFVISCVLAIIAFFVIYNIVQSTSQPMTKKKQANGESSFLNHYKLASANHSSFSSCFLLERDENPNFDNDIIQPSKDNEEYKKIRAVFTTESDHRLRVKISAVDKKQWEIPFGLKEELDDDAAMVEFQKFKLNETGFKFSSGQNGFHWGLNDVAIGGNSSILTTKDSYFRFMEKYLSLEFLVPSQRILGMGERRGNTTLRDGTYTLFPRDQGSIVENRINPGKNLYGYHPFMMYQLPDNMFAGIYFRTTSPMEVKIADNAAIPLWSTVRVTVVSGVIDCYIFYKGPAQFIIQQYHSLLGKPVLPPLWALGYHHGKTGYKSVAEIKQLVDNFDQRNIPIDAIWTDIDILDGGKNFIINHQAFPKLSTFVKSYLHSRNIKFVPVLEPSLLRDNRYQYYLNASFQNGLIKSKFGENAILFGRTRLGDIAYPNFLNRYMQDIWKQGVREYAESTGMDGLWMTGNEFNNLCNGECGMKESDVYDNLPFVPGKAPLNTSTISMSAIYQADPIQSELNIHSLNSLMMANFTYQAALSYRNSQRPFLITRSSFPGIQKFASGHWFGSTPGTWEQLQHTISGVLNFAMFGIPLSAPSIAGYHNDTDEELFCRWLQLGALLPLTVNFHDNSAITPDPLGFSAKTESLMKNAIRMKYSLLRYIYTTIFESSLLGGAPIQPVFFEFPSDKLAFRTSSASFLYGKGLMIGSPTKSGQKAYSLYFPNANWYSLPSGTPIYQFNPNKTEGAFLQVDVATDQPKVFARGGSIIPFQDAMGARVRSISELQELPTTLIVALDEQNKATGRLAVDDGVSDNTIASKKYRHYHFSFMNKHLKVMLLNGYEFNNTDDKVGSYGFENLTTIKILGAKSFANVTSACLIPSSLARRKLNLSYDATTQILTLSDTAKRKISWKSVEAIGIFTDDDYNYCAGGFSASKIKITGQLRRMQAALDTGNDLSERKYTMEAIMLNDYVVNMRIKPGNWTGWEVPGIVDNEIRNSTKGKKGFAEYMFAISMSPDLFYFVVANPGDPEDTLITSQDMPIVLDEHFTQVTTIIKASEIYGLGERVSSGFALKPGKYTIYSRDVGSPLEDGDSPGKNMYGTHPFYLIRIPDGSFAAVFFLTSNAMDVSIMPFDESTYKVDHITSGGIIDMFVIQRGPPNKIIELYHNIIGKPHLVPYWAFGNHQSRYGYRTQGKLTEVVKKFAEQNIPLEGKDKWIVCRRELWKALVLKKIAIWSDIDYMDNYLPFTLDKQRYPDMVAFTKWIHETYNMKFIPIVEAAIPVQQDSKAYADGLQKHIFIQRGPLNQEYNAKYPHTIGVVWPGYSAFVDFLHPNASEYWSSMLEYLATFLPFDGIWLDMNEISNFCDGDCSLYGNRKKPLEVNIQGFDDLVYVPGHRSLQEKSLALDARHYNNGGYDDANYVEYNLHSMFGHYEIKATSEYFEEKRKRPMIIARSTFAGSGRYGSHWLGDNKSQWPFLKYSIIGIYNFQMFGIPFTGADVCGNNYQAVLCISNNNLIGFNGNTTVELCRRWYQLAAFYPFCRNHNEDQTIDQEPYQYKDLNETAKKALQLRYSLLRYIYTQHMLVAMNGGMYFKPLFFEFPSDNNTYLGVESTFMVGPALKITPILTENTKSVISYFPNWNWYSLSNGEEDLAYNPRAKEGVNLTVNASIHKHYINVHIKGGSVIIRQDVASLKFLNTQNLTRLPIEVVIAPDHHDSAEGQVIFDDGESSETLIHKAYHLYTIRYSNAKVFIDLVANKKYFRSEDQSDEVLDMVTLFGAKAYMNEDFACAILHSGKRVRLWARKGDVKDVIKFVMPRDEKYSLIEILSIVWNDPKIKC